MTAPRPRRSGRLILAVLLALPLLLLGLWLLRRDDAPAARFDAALDRALQPVLAQHQAALAVGASTPKQLRLLSREAAASSLQYLAPADLELWAATRLRVAQSSSDACARLWQGGDAAFVGRAVAELGDDALEAYTSMLARGLSLRLERKPPIEPAPGAIARATRAIADALPSEQRAAFLADVGRADLSPARACELFLTLSTGAQRLPPPTRIEFLRALAKELPVANH